MALGVVRQFLLRVVERQLREGAYTEDKARVRVRGQGLGLGSGLEPGLGLGKGQDYEARVRVRIRVKAYRVRLESTPEVDAGLVVLVVNGQIHALVRELADLS